VKVLQIDHLDDSFIPWLMAFDEGNRQTLLDDLRP
jgi:hypothetical protein